MHTDGIAVDSSRNVRILNCHIDTGDDGIVVKAGKDADGLRVARPSEDIVIADCTVAHAHGAVTLGSETSGWIRNLIAANIVCDGTEAGIRIKSRRGRGGGVADVRFVGWTMRHVGTAIDITNTYRMEGELPSAADPTLRTTPFFRNISISRVTVHGAKVVASIVGLPEMPIDGLRIDDLVAGGARGLVARHTNDLELRAVRIACRSGPAFQIRNSAELDLDDVSSPVPDASATVRLDRCPGAVVRNCLAFPSKTPFLSVGPGQLSRTFLASDILSAAAPPVEESAATYPPADGSTRDD